MENVSRNHRGQKSHDMLFASWSPRKTGGLRRGERQMFKLSEAQSLRPSGLLLNPES
jgi:hypothetical protein